ncbi:MAG: nitrite reductase small subunit NirD [Acidimicrobiia bacterium]|nr:nitrite reductase small subunit NirD [Acidimicrobiia bacterium]
MWTEVCDLDTLTPDRGVAALLDGVPVAVFRLSADVDSSHVVAVDHVDPVSGVGVMARGLVGSVGVRDVVVSPLLKQRFDLHTGECLDDPGVWLRTWPVRVADGRVLVGGVAPPAGG